jgi:hypothetical protein
VQLVDAPSVNAPWVTLPVEGYFLPFVIDLQSELLDLRGIDALPPRSNRSSDAD